MLTRIEFDVTEGIRTVIDQTVYRNEEGHVVILDSIDPEPEGYEEIDPSELTKEE